MESIKYSFKVLDVHETLETQIQIQLFILLLEKCSRLKEFTVWNEPNPTIGLKRTQKLFHRFSENLEIAAAKDINLISIDISAFVKEEVYGFKQFISRLPNLKEIKLTGVWESAVAYLQVISVFCEIFKTFEATLQIQINEKEFSV